jgi:hypothetical protein
MSLDDDSLILRNVTPDKLKQIPSKIQVLTAEDDDDEEEGEQGEYEEYAKEEEEEEDDDYDDDEEEDDEEDNGDGDIIDHGDNNVGRCGNGCVSGADKNIDRNVGIINDRKFGMITTSGLSVGSISSVGVGSISAYTNISVSSSVQDSIMKRLLLNVAVDPEPFDDIKSTITSMDLPDIERPQKRSRINPHHIPSQPFPDKSLPTELLDDFIAYTKEYKARKRYEMGQYTDVTQIIMNYALKKHLLLKKFFDTERLNIRWMFEFWKSKECKMPSLIGGRNVYSQIEERAIERGLYQYPPLEEKDANGKTIYNYRWSKIFWDDTYHELLKKRSPQSIKDKARGTRNREEESIVALYHVQCKYRLKLQMLLREFSVEVKKKRKEIMMKKKN